MLARLWWKEARLFLPIWSFLFLASASCQWLTIHFLGRDARGGMLAVMAIGWTSLYAFTVASAAFAGEREGKTLTFLDALPVARSLLWRGKTSFAIVTTLLLALVLLSLAAVWTDRWPTGESNPLLVSLGVVALFLEIIGWGLLCSALMENALAAAGISVACALIVSPLLRLGFDFDPSGVARDAPYRLLLAIATAAVSGLVITRKPRPYRGAEASSTILDQSEIAVVSPRSRVRARKTRWWPSALRVLLWETTREGWPLFWKLAIVVTTPALLAGFTRTTVLDPAFYYMATLGATILAGVGIFGREHRGRTNRFLAGHGATPGLVWLVKVAAWTCALLVLWFPLSLTVATFPGREYDRISNSIVIPCAFTATAVAMLCGMMVRRGITAVVVAAALFLAVFVPQVALLGAGLMPAWWLFLTPLVVVIVSRAWAYDWLLERPGMRRWFKLVALLLLGFGSVSTAYVTYRVREIPETFPGFTPTPLGVSLLVPSTPPPGQNAARLYLLASRSTTPLRNFYLSDEVLGESAFVLREEAKTWLAANQEPLKLVRDGTRLSGCELAPSETLTLFSRYDRPAFQNLAGLLGFSALAKQEAGDLDAAWDDLLAMFRLARHAAEAEPDTGWASRRIEYKAFGLAMRWSLAPKQTRERIRAALAQYQALPSLPNSAETLLRWSAIADRTLLLLRSRIAEHLDAIQAEGSPRRNGWQHFLSEVATTPWEIARARRVLHALLVASIEIARHEPWNRNDAHRFENARVFQSSLPLDAQLMQRNIDVAELLRTTPLARNLYPPLDGVVWDADRNEVERRALVQIFALRSWQLAHDGRLPETLQELVPSELPSLPLDPYTNQPFGYLVAQGQRLPRLGFLDPMVIQENNPFVFQAVGDRLLFSVGPNRRNDAANRPTQSATDEGDLIFPIPDSPEIMKQARKRFDDLERAARQAEQLIDGASLPMGTGIPGGAGGPPPFLPPDPSKQP